MVLSFQTLRSPFNLVATPIPYCDNFKLCMPQRALLTVVVVFTEHLNSSLTPANGRCESREGLLTYVYMCYCWAVVEALLLT